MVCKQPVLYRGIRRLWPSDQEALTGHFQRLDNETRRLRFAGTVSNRFVETYAQTMFAAGSAIFGAFPDGKLRGIAEVRSLTDSLPRTAELALAVEPDWQARGLGEALFLRAITAARTRQITALHMLCLPENTRMRMLARKHQAAIEFGYGAIEATLPVSQISPLQFLAGFFGIAGRSYPRTTRHPGRERQPA